MKVAKKIMYEEEPELDSEDELEQQVFISPIVNKRNIILFILARARNSRSEAC